MKIKHLRPLDGKKGWMPFPSLGCFVFLVVLFGSSITGCTSSPSTQSDGQVIVTTMPVLGLIISPIAETYTVDILLKNGQSPHGFQISPSQAKTLSAMDLLVYAHPDIDGWATDLASENAIPLWGEVEVEGEGHQSSAHDAHYWTDPAAVLDALQTFSDALCERQPLNCVDYRRNANAFSVRIDSIQTQIRAQLESIKEQCFVVAQPFMTQFLDRFDVASVGPLQPLPGHDASPKTLGEHMKQAKNAGCETLLVQEAVDNQAMVALAKDMDVKLVEVDPLGARAPTYEQYLLNLALALTGKSTPGGTL